MIDALFPPEPAGLSPTERTILDAGTTCVRRFGIRRTTLEEVARVAGVSRGTVYRYFSSKEDLVTAVLAGAESAFVAETLDAIADEPTLAGKVAANALLLRDQTRHRLVLGLDETEPETVAVLLTRDVGPLFERWIEVWMPMFAAAAERGEVRADLDLPRAIEWMLRIMMSLVTTPPVTFDIDDDAAVRSFVTDHLVRGFS